jgi:ribonuclease HII
MKTSCLNVIQKLTNDSANILVDGNKLIKNFSYPQKYIIKGDAKSASIAAASILAKVSRDHFMNELAKEFPQYNWDKNKGYLSSTHIEAIKEFGATKWHRKKFLRNILEQE